ncbi:MAG: Asp-tRNA(Asn)/Glu-tRNA(Gln) amidotransferase subunit GatB [Dehalococcoidia bacterium]|nr:Asp-tRNA(Asn)/Glu-tRNA(Gln) amidotransferase subunit GatB [Dehalococcoidia bacterium]
MEWEAVIGLEVHAQLLTRSKMFCPCPADYQSAEPNTRVCPICLGMPGVLPVINQQAVEFTIMTGLALQCTIASQTHFDRKNYPYPDLMKGYQISQYAHPIAYDGALEIEVDGQSRRIGIVRVHLEEDVAKLHHFRQPTGEAYSLVDVNRSGVPLMEIVSKPDLRSPEEARLYLMRLRTILQYLGVCSGDMEKGTFRCDANVSIRPKGSTTFMPKVEVKNMNSFRAVQRALEYEVQRQIQVVESGGRVVQETRGWLEEKGITVPQRTKEFAHDYRYFPEPDLPPLVISRAWVERLRQRLPELPDARRERFITHYGLPRYDATLLTASKEMADYFEACLRIRPQEGEALRRTAKAISNWLLGEVSRLLNLHGREISQVKVSPADLVALQDLVDKGTLSISMAKTVLEEMFATGHPPARIVQERGMVQVSAVEEVLPAVEEALRTSPQAVQDYLKGKETALRYLVGQVMKITKGKANPTLVNTLLKERLEALKKGG